MKTADFCRRNDISIFRILLILKDFRSREKKNDLKAIDFTGSLLDHLSQRYVNWNHRQFFILIGTRSSLCRRTRKRELHLATRKRVENDFVARRVTYRWKDDKLRITSRLDSSAMFLRVKPDRAEARQGRPRPEIADWSQWTINIAVCSRDEFNMSIARGLSEVGWGPID